MYFFGEVNFCNKKIVFYFVVYNKGKSDTRGLEKKKKISNPLLTRLSHLYSNAILYGLIWVWVQLAGGAHHVPRLIMHMAEGSRPKVCSC